MLKINEKVPDFKAMVYHKDEFQEVDSAQYRGKWLVLIFYPADFTFVCPTELEDAQKHYHEMQKLGAEVFSVSTDTHFTHKAWHDSSPAIGKVDYPMLADPSGALCEQFGTYITEGEDAGLSLRGTFIIDPDGVLKTIEIHANNIGRSGHELLRKLQAAKFVREHKGLVCPAEWEPGADTLEPGAKLVGKI
ncbi:MAG: peroxiredoxin [Candidatus Vogelbacteria bacterium CG10_big_fil_rev_8_21_14_0_10_51_16]|uniref:Peroxiredoxin n=1 Tax=Candidatus Vogelbacteria bacterium CG10_big_fil_rev_8_21_14_0_10_51_16 TaxID=1975045 RepID=A0A2H0REN7_9BACT|nr:MAG: peroxiredoxin [Candidatus Vogelbacteria bacterium CG10_big_fil_rev_8_21_14_0_10_51_16]